VCFKSVIHLGPTRISITLQHRLTGKKGT